MYAVIQKEYGAPDVLQWKETRKPSPDAGEVLIAVHAAGVNRTDCANLRARPFIMRFVNGLLRPRKIIPGTAFAGRVVAAGAGVTEYNSGDRVFGFDDSGLKSLAQYMTFPENKAIGHIPSTISYNQAAASIEGAHYAINFLNKVKLVAGQRALVNGATGAIGSATVQLLKHYRVQVTAVCAGRHGDLIKSLGATRVIDYETEDFTNIREQYNYVFDTVGKSSFGKCKPLLKPGGIYISSELGKAAENLFFSILTSFWGRKKVKFPLPLDPKGSVEKVRELMATGQFSPLIDRVYPPDEVVTAYHYVESGKKLGNVIIEFHPHTQNDLNT
jgi:NADPH:quinone reductase-like Zn-dependent oxidoreductase